MSGLIIFVTTPIGNDIPIELTIEATVADLIAASDVNSDHQLRYNDRLYSSNDNTSLADLGICPEARVELVLSRRKKLIAIVERTTTHQSSDANDQSSDTIVFSITNAGVLFDLPYDLTKDEAYELAEETANRIHIRAPFPGVTRVRFAILPDYGSEDVLLSDHPTQDTLFGLPLPEFLRESLVRQCPVAKYERYEWINNWLPNINVQLNNRIMRDDLSFVQTEGLISPGYYPWHNAPYIPSDYKIGDPLPPAKSPTTFCLGMTLSDDAPVRKLATSEYKRNISFFWDPPIPCLLGLPVIDYIDCN